MPARRPGPRHAGGVQPDTELHARLFDPDDAEPTASMIARTLTASNAADYSPDVIESLVAWYSPEGLRGRIPFSTRLVVTDADGAIVGTAARRENRLEGFFVEPSWQGGGIGRFLLEGLEADARFHAMRALCVDSSLTAVGFYEACGFVASGPARDLGEGLVVPLRKVLDA